MPRVSIVVPVYNVEQYLERCVNSILNQTYRDFELILVDDGSPDNCPKMCDEFAKKDSRIIVIHQKNQGLSGARNSGIEYVLNESNSEWITFVDSDDWVHPQYIELLLNAVETFKCDVSVTQFKICEKFFDEYEYYDKSASAIMQVEDVYETERFIANGANAKLYKKKLFEDIRYPIGKLHEDRFTTYKILFRYKSIAVVDLPLFNYYINLNGIVHSKWSLRRLDNLEAAEQQIEFFKNRNMERPYIFTLKEYVHLMVCSLKEMKKYKNEKDYRIAANKIRRKLRKTIKKYGKKLEISFPKDLTTYKYAYPFIIKIYLRIDEYLKRKSRGDL